MSEPRNAIRVPAAQVLRSPVHLLAFWFGCGLSPKGPGTAGTAGAMPLWLLLQWWSPSLPLYLGLLALLFAFGCWVCGESARRLGVHQLAAHHLLAGLGADEVIVEPGEVAPARELQRGAAPGGGWGQQGFGGTGTVATHRRTG